MSIISAGGAVVGAGAAAGGYQIERSLRFNSADSAYLNRTFGASNQKTWTYSFWIKRSKLTRVMLLGAYTSASDVAVIEIDSDQINWYDYLSAYRYELRTTQVLRDPSAWYHIMCVLDTTQATSSNRNKIYINGSLVTALTTATYPTQNLDGKFNTAIQHSIGTEGSNVRLTFDGYQTETYFIDGQALDETSFGEFNATTGVWQPKAYTGSYGTNGFYLNFSDNTSTTTLGEDQAGSNDWTTNNFSVTAGAGNDSLVDTPTNYGTDTGVGGEVRGNYATLNPIFNPNGTIVTYANGNLDFSHSASGGNAPKMVVMSTMAIPLQGKWYWEYTVGSTVNDGVGISNELVVGGGARGSASAAYNDGGSFTGDYTNPASAGSFSAGNIIGMAYDQSAGTLAFYKSNVLQGTITNISTTVTFFPYREPGSSSTSGAGTFNFGQRPFAYTAPSGFKALVTQNLPESEATIPNGGEYFNTVEWTGTGSGQSITGMGFQPDWLWFKSRNNANDHALMDVVRGATKGLSSNSTAAEVTSSAGQDLVSFDADGFTTGTPTNYSSLGSNGFTIVTWGWKANGSGVSNTDGTITSTVSANTDSGFSIATYTGNGSTGTVGHGLGATPDMIIVKSRSTAQRWTVFHTSTSNAYIYLNETFAAETANANLRFGNNTVVVQPTLSVFSIGNSVDVNQNTTTYVAYCFAAIPSFSAMGSYLGNGSADGPFVYTGFRPRFVMIKRTDSSDAWLMNDTSRSNYNGVNYWLQAESSGAESTNSPYQSIYLSNGFKLTGTSTSDNASGGTYIYMAFAENPFKIALAR
jgi:hypothetical protein